MMVSNIFKGSMVAMATPMQAGIEIDVAIDNEALEALVEFHIENETDTIVAVGTTGESATLDHQEHCAVIKRVVEIVNKRIPVIAGTGANSTREAIELTQCAKSVGADACLLVTPYYNKPTQEGLFLHHKAIAEAVAIPQILYNVPGRTACDMLPETVAKLAKVDGIIGAKEATGEIERVHSMRTLIDDEDFLLFSGDDATSKDFLLAGGNGVITVTGNIAPQAMHDMCMAALAGDTEEANRIDMTIAELHEVLFIEPNPIPVKWALERMGLMQKGIRLPLTWLSNVLEPKMEKALQQATIL